jgi:hypothetical protein
VSESIESLLEFLRISSRVAVVQLEPPRARAFADALRLAMEFKEAAIRKAVTEEREACAKLCDRLAGMSSQPPNDFDECAAAIRARGRP